MNNNTKPKDAVVSKPKECTKTKTHPPVEKNGDDGPATYAAILVGAWAGVASVPTIAILSVDQPSTRASNHPQQQSSQQAKATPSQYYASWLRSFRSYRHL
jgi:hypothetical protein